MHLPQALTFNSGQLESLTVIETVPELPNSSVT